MTEKAHNYELHPCDSTVLCLDYAQNGIGSASCGPRLAEQYRLDDASFDFSIRLIPEKSITSLHKRMEKISCLKTQKDAI